MDSEQNWRKRAVWTGAPDRTATFSRGSLPALSDPQRESRQEPNTPLSTRPYLLPVPPTVAWTTQDKEKRVFTQKLACEYSQRHYYIAKKIINKGTTQTIHQQVNE